MFALSPLHVGQSLAHIKMIWTFEQRKINFSLMQELKNLYQRNLLQHTSFPINELIYSSFSINES